MTKTTPALSFAKLETGMPMPHLLDIQTRAFASLLQPDGKGAERTDVGLERVFKDVFPIADVNGNYSLEFVKYALGEPKYTVEECIERDMTYSVPLKATLQLVVMEEVGETVKTKRPKNIIEKEVYLGELPILTPLGTFVINGAERVIVSQLHRSPGVVFEESIHPNGQRLFSARIIPFRGSWVEFTIDIHDVIYVHIDKKKKFPATALLRAFGYGTNAEILKLFYATKDIDITGKLEGRAQKREVLGTLLAADVPDPENKKGEPLARVGDELTLERFNAFRRAGITGVKVFAGYTALDLREDAQPTTTQQAQGKHVLAFDVADPETGEVVAEAGREVSDTLKKKLIKAGVTKVDVLLPAGRSESPLIKNTLLKDPTHTEAEALEQIYALLRPGEAPNLETARQALERLFFHPKRYDLGRVGRYKINQRLKVNVPKDHTVLTEDDFIAIIRYLIELREGRGYTDDIDHLGNRRVRSVGELIANQFSVGLSRMARLIKERMSINNDPERITLDDLVNARTVSAVIQAFFGSSQLSQFMDQTNPLAELTHKRRLSALGPGGLTRERAGFEVRDVHYSQYGRMCPIETPEGPNIGLITSLSCYARVNDLGFIETPYRVVKSGKVTDETRWLSASEEEEYAVAQANARLTEDGHFADELVLCRKRDDYPLLPPARIDFMDVAPEQLVSIAAALIPFLEHDDANRALMGSNMQRQSVPLLFPQAPLVGTGLEETVARDSGAVVIARRAGVVTRVTADEIIIDAGEEEAKSGDHPLARLKQHDRYRLKKFWRTNQDTAINQRPLVQLDQKVKAGQIVADGAGTERGELALGANVLVAFMPWYGHNFEDAIVLSERLVKDDVYSSIHIQELELHVRDTKRGREEITREIPNVAEESLVDLDERGIVRIGAHVKAGDILVGKITPKGENELSPEEKLLTAIFGEKAEDVKDSSLKVPPGMEGVVIDVKIFSRIEDQVVEKDRGERIGEVRRLETDEKARISEAMFAELRELLAGQEIGLMLKAGTVEEYLPQGTKLSRQQLAEINFADVDLKTLRVTNKPVNERIRAVLDAAAAERAKIEEKSEDQIDKILQPDELPPGVIQLVKVYVAEKRKISVGDKMAGRNGNKGIIARIVPEEDMPFLPDGTPVDIVLNPLGVPSRMNVGQILETHLGWAATILGFEAKTPVFQGGRDRDRRAAAARRAHLGGGRAAAGGAPPRGRLGDGAPHRGRPGTPAPGQRRPPRSRQGGDRAARGPGAHPGDPGRAPQVRGFPARRGQAARRAGARPAQGRARVPSGPPGERGQGAVQARAGGAQGGTEGEREVRGARQAPGGAGSRGAAGARGAPRAQVGGGPGPGGERPAQGGRPHPDGEGAAARRTVGRVLRVRRDRRLDLHDEAVAPGGRQDSRPLHRAVLAGHPATARRQGAVRRPAVRRDGGVGVGSVRRRAHAARDPHGQVGRRERPQPRVRGDRQGAEPAETRHPRVLQRVGEGTPGPGAEGHPGHHRRR